MSNPNREKVRQVYNDLSEYYDDLGTPEEFEGYMADDSKRELALTLLKQHYNVTNDFESFTNALGYGKNAEGNGRYSGMSYVSGHQEPQGARSLQQVSTPWGDLTMENPDKKAIAQMQNQQNRMQQEAQQAQDPQQPTDDGVQAGYVQGKGFGMASKQYGDFATQQYLRGMASSVAGMRQGFDNAVENAQSQTSFGQNQRKQESADRFARANSGAMMKAYSQIEGEKYGKKVVDMMAGTMDGVKEQLMQQNAEQSRNMVKNLDPGTLDSISRETMGKGMDELTEEEYDQLVNTLVTPTVNPEELVEKTVNSLNENQLNELISEYYGKDFKDLSEKQQQEAMRMLQDYTWQALGKEYQVKGAFDYIVKSTLTGNLMGRLISATSNRSKLDEMAKERYGTTYNELVKEDQRRKDEVAMRMYGKPMDDLEEEEQSRVTERAMSQYKLRGDMLAEELRMHTTEGLSNLSMMDYEKNLSGVSGALIKGTAGFTTMVADGVPFMLAGGIGGWVGKQMTAYATEKGLGGLMMRSALKGVTSTMSRNVIAEGVLNAARTQITNKAIASGLTFGLYDMMSAGVQSYSAGNLSIGDMFWAGAKGTVKGAMLGGMNYGVERLGQRFAKATGKMGVAKRVGTSVGGYMSEVAFFAGLEHLERNGFTYENFDWSTVGEQMVLIGLMKAKGQMESSDPRSIMERWKNPVAEEMNARPTQEDIDTLVSLGYGKKSSSVEGWVKSMYDLVVDAETGESRRGNLEGAIVDDRVPKELRQKIVQRYGRDGVNVGNVEVTFTMEELARLSQLGYAVGRNGGKKIADAINDQTVPIDIRRKLLFGWGVATPEATAWAVSEPEEVKNEAGNKTWRVTSYTENSKPIAVRTFASRREADAWVESTKNTQVLNHIKIMEQTAGNRDKQIMKALYDISNETGRPLKQLVTAYNLEMSGQASTMEKALVEEAKRRAETMMEAQRRAVVDQARKETDGGWDSTLEEALTKDPEQLTNEERQRLEKYRNTLRRVNDATSLDPRVRMMSNITTEDGKVIKALDASGNTVYVPKGIVIKPNGEIDMQATKNNAYKGAVLVYDQNGMNPKWVNVTEIGSMSVMQNADALRNQIMSTYDVNYGAQVGNIVTLRKRFINEDGTYEDRETQYKVMFVDEDGSVKLESLDGSGEMDSTEAEISYYYMVKQGQEAVANRNAMMSRPVTEEEQLKQSLGVGQQQKPATETAPVASGEQPVSELPEGYLMENGAKVHFYPNNDNENGFDGYYVGPSPRGSMYHIVTDMRGNRYEVGETDIEVPEQKATGNAPATTPPQAPAEQPVESMKTTVNPQSGVIVDEKGNPTTDNDAKTVAESYVSGTSGVSYEQGKQIVEYMISDKIKQYQTLEKKEPKFSGDTNKYNQQMQEWQQQLDKIKQEGTWWRSVQQEMQRMNFEQQQLKREETRRKAEAAEAEKRALEAEQREAERLATIEREKAHQQFMADLEKKRQEQEALEARHQAAMSEQEQAAAAVEQALAEEEARRQNMGIGKRLNAVGERMDLSQPVDEEQAAAIAYLDQTKGGMKITPESLRLELGSNFGKFGKEGMLRLTASKEKGGRSIAEIADEITQAAGMDENGQWRLDANRVREELIGCIQNGSAETIKALEKSVGIGTDRPEDHAEWWTEERKAEYDAAHKEEDRNEPVDLGNGAAAYGPEGTADFFAGMSSTDEAPFSRGKEPGTENVTKEQKLATNTVMTALEVAKVPVEIAERQDVNNKDIPLSTKEGKVYGWMKDGKIYLTADGLNPNTPIHEYTHLWSESVKKNAPELWNNVKELMKQTEIWQEVLGDDLYQSIHGDEDRMASEVLSRLSGRRGAERMKQMAKDYLDKNPNASIDEKAAHLSIIAKLKKAIDDVWKFIGQNLFDTKEFKSAEEVADRTLYDLVNGTDLKTGKALEDTMMSVGKQKEAWEQDFGSGATSINSNKLPTGFALVEKAGGWKEGTVALDMGGGRFDNAVEMLNGKGVELLVFDPYNRDASHNRMVAQRMKEEGADETICNNCLNVINSAGARSNVILQCAKALKPGGTAYFTIYEGNGTGVGKQTKADCWQENRKTADYLDEIRQHFNDVTMKGKLIIARDPKQTSEQSYWNFNGMADEGGISFSKVKAEGADHVSLTWRKGEDETKPARAIEVTWPATGKKSTEERDRKYGVGKRMGGVYFHKDYAGDVVPADVLEKATKIADGYGFKYNTMYYDEKNPTQLRFDEAPDFDTAREPIPGDMLLVDAATGKVVPDSRGNEVRHSDMIWHHKWQWVKDDYKGFDVQESFDWSVRWKDAFDQQPAGIGSKRVWDEKLSEAGLPVEESSAARMVKDTSGLNNGSYDEYPEISDEYTYLLNKEKEIKLTPENYVSTMYQMNTDYSSMIHLGVDNTRSMVPYDRDGHKNKFFATYSVGMNEFTHIGQDDIVGYKSVSGNGKGMDPVYGRDLYKEQWKQLEQPMQRYKEFLERMAAKASLPWMKEDLLGMAKGVEMRMQRAKALADGVDPRFATPTRQYSIDETENATSDENNGKELWNNGEKSVISQSETSYKKYLTPEYRKEAEERARKEGKMALPQLAFISEASKAGVVIPVDEIMAIPEIAEAQKKIDEQTEILKLSRSQKKQEAQLLLDNYKSAVQDPVTGKWSFDGEVKKEKKLFIVIGRPAGGKSSVFANPLSQQHKARIIDSDDAKKTLPGYDNGNGAGYVNHASSQIADAAARNAILEGDNIVLPRIGGPSVIDFAIYAKENGYEVNLYYNDIPLENSVMRSAARFAETGRYLDLGYLQSIEDKPYLTLSKYYNKSLNEVKYEKSGKQEERANQAELHRKVNAGGSGSWSGLGRDRRDLEQLSDQKLFDHVEWKNNDVPFKTQPETIWTSEDGVALPENGGRVDRTTTNQFKKYFGDWEKDPENASKVVDQQGRPMVLSHGTPFYGFTIFNTRRNNQGEITMGSHFGSREAANDRLKNMGSRAQTTSTGIYDVYLNIRKPWECTDWFDQDDPFIMSDLAKLAMDNRDNETVQKYWGYIKNWESWSKDYTDQELYDATFLMDGSQRGFKGLDSYKSGEIGELYNFVRSMVQAAGYDGIKYYNTIEGKGYSWVVFSPEQIKSAETRGKMANNGNFDVKNPDIRYSIDEKKTAVVAGNIGVDRKLMADVQKVTGIGVRMGNASDFGSRKESAYFDHETNEIVINPNGNGANNFTGVMGHEVLHTMEQIEGYDKLQDQLLRMVYGSEEEVQDAIISTIERYGRAKHLLTPDQARREVAADVCKNALFGGRKGAERFAEAMRKASGDQWWGEKLYGKMRDWMDRIIEMVKGRPINGISIKELQEARDAYAEMAKKVRLKNDERLMKDRELVNEHGDVLGRVDNDHNVQLTLATYRDFVDEFGVKHEGTRTRIENYMMKNGFSQDDVANMLWKMDWWEGYMKNLSKFTNEDGTLRFQAFHDWNVRTPQYKVIGAHTEKVLSALVNNGEYPVNLELSTDCIKRETFTQLLNEIARIGGSALKNLNPGEITAIQEMMKSHGVQTACPLCFVEGKRLMIRNWGETIANDWNLALNEALGLGIKTKNIKVMENGKAKTVTVFADPEKAKQIMDEKLGAFGFYKEGDEVVSDQPLGEYQKGEPMDITTARQKQSERVNNVFNILSGRKGGLLSKDMRDMDKQAKKVEQRMLEMEHEWAQKNPGKPWVMTKKQQDEIDTMLLAGKKKVYDKMLQAIAQYPELRHTLSLNDMIGNAGLDALRAKGGKEAEAFERLFSLMLSRFGSGTPKVVQRSEPYAGEIMEPGMDNAVHKADSEGGWRLFSFSDFDITKVFDIMQIMWDAETRKAKLQSYSKEVPYILMFGRGTNAKINMSTLAQAGTEQQLRQWTKEYYQQQGDAAREAYKKKIQEYVGLQTDGNGRILGFVWSKSHSVSPKFAEEIFHDDNYNANCGATTVGVGVNHTLWSCLTPWIRQVIPFHLSGMPLAARERTDVGWYRDATKDQNTNVLINGSWVSIHSKAAKDKKLSDFNFYEGEDSPEWDMRQRCRDYVKWCEWNGYKPRFQWAVNAEEYAKWCKENGYDVNKQIYDAMKSNETDGVFNGYYKVITDFNTYKPVFDKEGNMIGEERAPHKPIKGDFAMDDETLGMVMSNDGSMLDNRERNIGNGNGLITQMASKAVRFLKGEISEQEMMNQDTEAFKNDEDSEVYLRNKNRQYTIDEDPDDDPTTPGGGGSPSPTGDERVRSLEEMINYDAREFKREFDLMKDENDLKVLGARVREFIRNRMTPMAGKRMTMLDINGLLKDVDTAMTHKTKKGLERALDRMQILINQAEGLAEIEEMMKTLNTRTTTVDKKGMVKGVLVDTTANEVLNNIKTSYYNMMSTNYEDRMSEVRREMRALKQEYGITRQDDPEAPEEFKTRMEALKSQLSQLKTEHEQMQGQQVDETVESLEDEERKITEEINGMTVDENGNAVNATPEQMESKVQLKMALPIRKRLAELRQMMKAKNEIVRELNQTSSPKERQRLEREMDQMQRKINITSREITAELKDIIGQGRGRRAEMVKADIERQQKIVRMGCNAVRDAEVPDTLDKKNDDTWWKRLSSGTAKLRDQLQSPIFSFNFLAKYIDHNNAQGEGEFYTYFMKGENGALKANNEMSKGMRENMEAVDQKMQELFGKTYDKVKQDAGKKTDRKIMKLKPNMAVPEEQWNEEYKRMTKGQMLYAWLTWRQEAGRTKMQADGWTRQSIREMEEQLGSEYLEFGRWLTEEHLKQLRDDKYNVTYEKVMGTSMHKAAHYFPLRIDKLSIADKSEVGQDGTISLLPSSSSGNLIVRTTNRQPVDLSNSAFDVLEDYNRTMERWNAMAELTKDLNTLIKSPAFRNLMEANHEGLFDRWKDACAVVTASYNSKGNDIDKALGTLHNGFMQQAIGYGWYTAIKQTLSAPAFMAYSSNPKYWLYMGVNTTPLTAYHNYKWCKENLPSFQERIALSDMGIEGMNDKSWTDYLSRKFKQGGMAANKLVDACTVANGARAIYEYDSRRFKKMLNEDGTRKFTDREAEEMAKVNAQIAFNESQQSSRNEFSSPIQKDRGIMTRAVVAFQNSNIGYRRMLVEGLEDMVRKDGNKGRGALKVLTVAALNAAWYMGLNPAITWRMVTGQSDDEDEKKFGHDMLLSVMLGYLSNGTILGPAMTAWTSELSEYSPIQVFDAAKTMVTNVRKQFEKEDYGAMTWALADYIMKSGGVNLEKFDGMYNGIYNAIERGEIKTDDILSILNLARTQRREFALNDTEGKTATQYLEDYMRADKKIEEGDYGRGWWNGKAYNKVIDEKKIKEVVKNYVKEQVPEFGEMRAKIEDTRKLVNARFEELKAENVKPKQKLSDIRKQQLEQQAIREVLKDDQEMLKIYKRYMNTAPDSKTRETYAKLYKQKDDALTEAIKSRNDEAIDKAASDLAEVEKMIMKMIEKTR